MTELFTDRTPRAQGELFADFPPSTAPANDNDAKRRPGETALDYRIRRQYCDLSATPPLFPLDTPRLRR
jgi:hypothetical protein